MKRLRRVSGLVTHANPRIGSILALDVTPPETQGAVVAGEPPAAPNMNMVHVNLHSVICTTHLAQHYFRLSPPDSGPRSMVITGSSASLYASAIAPAYCASKHGVLGWARSIAPSAWKQDQVRINVICPGIVRTNILPPQMFEVRYGSTKQHPHFRSLTGLISQMFPEEMLTPVSKVVKVVLMLVDGDGSGAQGGEALVGQAVEICGANHYVRRQHDYCDPTMAALMSVGG